jgi:hypothetical protein
MTASDSTAAFVEDYLTRPMIGCHTHASESSALMSRLASVDACLYVGKKVPETVQDFGKQQSTGSRDAKSFPA